MPRIKLYDNPEHKLFEDIRKEIMKQLNNVNDYETSKKNSIDLINKYKKSLQKNSEPDLFAEVE